jgi:hypothetical protein
MNEWGVARRPTTAGEALNYRVRQVRSDDAPPATVHAGAHHPGKLQDAGLIRYRRGKITVLDRPGLEARCCECYQVVKTEFDRLLPYVAQ